MEELKLLVDMVASLPQMALWVVAFFFAYKVCIIGSIYGVIRFVTEKIHDVIVTKKTRQIETKEFHVIMDGVVVKDCMHPLMAQISRLKDVGGNRFNSFIHNSDVDWLRQAIDAKVADDLRIKSEREKK